MAEIMYSCGLRVIEGVQLRVKDVDFAMSRIVVRISSHLFIGFPLNARVV
jgi:site-specific recombinase XerD